MTAKQTHEAGEVVPVQQTEIAPVSNPTPMQIIQQMVTSGADPENLKAMLEMQMTWEANEAKKAYVQAMAEFRKNPPTIKKSATVSYPTDKGVTEYKHAKLPEIVQVVGDALAEHDLSFHWETEAVQGGTKVTCIVTHKLGHSERASLVSAPDNSGGKNAIQAVGSAVTYLQRYTLMTALGLAAADDDDGKGSEVPRETLTDAQCTTLQAMLTDAGIEDKDVERWLGKLAKQFGQSIYSNIPAESFDKAKAILSDGIAARAGSE